MRRTIFTVAIGLLAVMPAVADILIFESGIPADNTATRTSWLTAIGIGTPQYLVDFETGFTNLQNISGIPGLFPLDMVIRDTSSAHQAIIRSGAGSINGSSPIGDYAVTQNEQAYLELDFSANPVDYFRIVDIDHTGTSLILTFEGGGTASDALDPAGSGEFYGVFRNDMPRIARVQFDSSGDGRWGVDNIEYGRLGTPTGVPEPSTLSLLAVGLVLAAGARRAFSRRIG